MKTMKTRTVVLITALALLAALAVMPVRADHVQEPTAHVTGIEIVAGSYPGFNKDPMKCDGTDVITVRDEDGDGTLENNNIRMEPQVSVAARPSEHWRLTFDFRSGVEGQKNPRQDWNVNPLFHQNAAPHGHGLVQGIGQFNHYRLEDAPGPHNMRAVVKGDESGLTYVTNCPFEVVVP